MSKNRDNNNNHKRYEMPDGKVVNIRRERFKYPEMLFNPRLLGMEDIGIERAIIQSIMSCSEEDDVRTDLLSNIVLCGGNTRFPGMKERLRKDIEFTPQVPE